MKAYDAGTMIYREGEPGEYMYGVEWGRVGIYSAYGTGDEQKLTEISARQFFGEMGMLCGEPRSATAVVLDDGTTLERISRGDMQALFTKNPARVWMVFEHIAMRLRTLTDEYAKVCREICDLQ